MLFEHSIKNVIETQFSSVQKYSSEISFYLLPKSNPFSTKKQLQEVKNYCFLNISDEEHGCIQQKFVPLTGPFRRFSTHVWQNAHINTVRCTMVCDVYSLFPKLL